ncbi:MAG: oligosaccharide flippase family protein [Gemmatimonadaceae bacterium]
MSRTRRFLGGLGLGFIGQVVITVVGLWLTPFLLRRLGQHDYGLWLVALQTTAYFGLLDLGVVALLPRETAYAVGRGGGRDDNAELPAVVGRTARLVFWQFPVIVLAAVATWLLLPDEWSALQRPFGVIIAVFVVMFPLRILHATLQGLQELAYIGAVQLGTWVLGTVTTISLVLSGWGLYALAVGWGASQLVSAVLWWARLRRRFPGALPSALPRLTWGAVRPQVASGLWVSAGQIAQVLVNATDLVIIGRLLGPAAVVPYAITGKLVSVLANQPQMVMQAAMPALSEVRASEQRHRLRSIASALTQAMLLISGLVVVVVLVVNQGFVSWWVGREMFGGASLTLLLLTSMLLRHWNTTSVYTLFCFGYERRISITTLFDGLITATASLLLVHFLGVKGAVLGSIVGVCLVSLPSNLIVLAREAGTSPVGLIRPLGAWFWRLIVLSALAIYVAGRWVPRTFESLAASGVIAASLYIVVMLPVALRSNLGAYLPPRLVPLFARLRRA